MERDAFWEALKASNLPQARVDFYTSRWPLGLMLVALILGVAVILLDALVRQRQQGPPDEPAPQLHQQPRRSAFRLAVVLTTLSCAAPWVVERRPVVLLQLAGAGAASLHQLTPEGVRLVIRSLAGVFWLGLIAGCVLVVGTLVLLAWRYFASTERAEEIARAFAQARERFFDTLLRREQPGA